MTNDYHSKISIERMSHILDMFLAIENREMVTKGLIRSNIEKGLNIYIRSNDHNPAHFHIESTQRKYHQKFSVEELENISTIKDVRFDAYIKKFFNKYPEYLQIITNEFCRLNPHLDTNHEN